jgi:hypothetical protein
MHRNLRRLILTFASVMVVVLALAPLSWAGEDGCSDDSSCSSSSGGSDTASASGGAQTGFGGMFVRSDGSGAIPLYLAGGSVVLLTLAGAAGVRARRAEL